MPERPPPPPLNTPLVHSTTSHHVHACMIDLQSVGVALTAMEKGHSLETGETQLRKFKVQYWLTAEVVILIVVGVLVWGLFSLPAALYLSRPTSEHTNDAPTVSLTYRRLSLMHVHDIYAKHAVGVCIE